tara:strand:- start:1177 stop:2268 length:1092 start_codon:yes stop_codon:yes gene_type:complete
MKKIYVTKPSLPSLEEYKKSLEKIWESRILTNDGPFHIQFEKKLKQFLGLKHITLVNNATSGLLISIKALGLTGEVITTPFTFIATSHSLIWNHITPVFVDTDDHYGNLCPNNIESHITSKTSGILGVHNYGFPGELEKINKIANKYDIGLIYDSAPAFNVKINNKSILNNGDYSILSFHATKVFTTFEGGAIISRNKDLKSKVDKLRNFAIEGPEKVGDIGINAKMSEPAAALGCLQLKNIKKDILARKKIFLLYNKSLKNCSFLRTLEIPKNVNYNFAYYPIFFKEGLAVREYFYKKFLDNGIICRKYWYPLIISHKKYKKYKIDDLQNSNKLSEQVLCLPIYPELSRVDAEKIISIIITK